MLIMYGRININTRPYWEKKWSTGGLGESENRMALYRHVASLIPQGSYVLDVGCGEGVFIELLRDEYSISGIGIDFSKYAITKLKSKGLKGVVAFATNIPFPADEFDVVIALELLEHLSSSDGKKALGQMKMTCKPKGMIIVSVPTPWGLKPQVEAEHLRTYTEGDIRLLISKYVEKVKVEASKSRIYWIVRGMKT
jgi:ubiquinone/menaquinone biosynthesis C-methylase UbiE